MTTKSKDSIESKAILNEKLAAAISMVVDLEASFKIFSYRIIGPEQFVEEVEKRVDKYAQIYVALENGLVHTND